jgi:hypothetical protein
LVAIYWQHSAEERAELRREFPAVFGQVEKPKPEKSDKAKCDAAAKAYLRAGERKTQLESKVQKLQTQLEEAEAQLKSAKEEFEVTFREHAALAKTYADAVRADLPPKPAAPEEGKKETPQGGDGDGDGADDRMELDEEWKPLLDTFSPEQKRLYEGARASNAAKRKRCSGSDAGQGGEGPSSEERAQQILGATRKMAARAASAAGERASAAAAPATTAAAEEDNADL